MMRRRKSCIVVVSLTRLVVHVMVMLVTEGSQIKCLLQETTRWNVMGRNKISGHRRGKTASVEMPPLHSLQSQGCRRVLAAEAPSGHPCPKDSPNRKKKSLSEVICPSHNYTEQSHVGTAVSQGNARPGKKSRGDVGTQDHPSLTRTIHCGSPSAVQGSLERSKENEVELPAIEVDEPFQAGCLDLGSSDVHKSKMVSEEEFKKKLRQLGREETKYAKKQAKKHAKWLSSGVGPSSERQSQGKEDLCPSTSASYAKASSSVCRNVVAELDSVENLTSWGAVCNIPPFEVNSLTTPTGEFWEHMRRNAFDQARFEFPWDVDWKKQCPKLKARFILQLRKVYPGPWDSKSILRAVGANLRERRTRLKRNFERSKNFKQVSKPAGCSKQSWTIIYESTKDIHKQEKAKLCKEVAEKRFNAKGCTHRCGPRGVKGLHDRFVGYFNQLPTDEELEYGKVNGWLALKEKRTTKNSEPNPSGARGCNLGNSSFSHDSTGLRSSSDSSSDSDTSSSESEEE